MLACEDLAVGVFVSRFPFLCLNNIVPARATSNIPAKAPNTIVRMLFLWFVGGSVVDDDDDDDDDDDHDDDVGGGDDDDDDVDDDDDDDDDDRLVDSEGRFVADVGLGTHFLSPRWPQCWFVAFKPCVTHSSCITSFPSKQQYEHCWQLWMYRDFLTK